MPDPISVFFVTTRLAGIILALAVAGYLIYDNILEKRMEGKTVIRIVLEGKHSKRRIKRLLEEKGYKVEKLK